ncbi:MAG TPA: hypothetical protein VJ570_03995 [Holophagaceae bacterium]|nr:hypothetical protein [Holophagaceae bacterium]
MHFLAVLGNVNKSILKVDLGDGFQIEEWPRSKFVSFFELMHGSAEHDIQFKIDEDWGYSHGRKTSPKSVFVVTKNAADYPEQNLPPLTPSWHKQFDKRFEYERRYFDLLDDKISKLRLSAPGSIKICVQIFYLEEGSSFELHSSREEGLHCQNRTFKIRMSNLQTIQRLLARPPLYATQKYIRFALDNYNQAYRVAQEHLEFISLMLALEAIFNDGKQELRNKVSRGCAVLLGKSREESRQIFKAIKDLYDKRSVLVHTGDFSKIHETDIDHLHEYVRRSLARAVDLNLSKEIFSSLLLETGFGLGATLSNYSTSPAAPPNHSMQRTSPLRGAASDFES